MISSIVHTFSTQKASSVCEVHSLFIESAASRRHVRCKQPYPSHFHVQQLTVASIRRSGKRNRPIHRFIGRLDFPRDRSHRVKRFATFHAIVREICARTCVRCTCGIRDSMGIDREQRVEWYSGWRIIAGSCWLNSRLVFDSDVTEKKKLKIHIILLVDVWYLHSILYF